MKKFTLLLVAALCLTLCGCPAAQEPGNAAKEVHITAGKIEPGMTAKDVLVEVTIDHEPVACRVALTCFTPTGYYELADDEAVPEDFYIRLDVYYSLPKGCDVDNINVTMECDGGVYDGTGSIGDDDQGNVEAWSHAFYGEEQTVSVHPVTIDVLKFAPGMTVEQIQIEVTVDGSPVDARAAVTELTDQGMRDLESTDTIPDKSLVRLNVYYYLEQGITLDDIDVTMNFPGGEYDGTGSMSEDDQGRVEAWSHALYDTREEQPTQPTATEPKPTDPKPTEPKPTDAPHTHQWTEQGSHPIVSCTEDSEKTYTCSCGATKTETVPAPGHDLAPASVVQPTCTKAGHESTSCRRCGQSFLTEIPALGHSWSAWVKISGSKHSHSCSVCGAEETEDHYFADKYSPTCLGCGEDIIN